ncbi:MAG: MBOAT family protein [Blautia sp.]|nr:MBOAT family protein [Blautia sp.]
MSFISSAFWIFVAVAVGVYYLAPGGFQWAVLLLFSVGYYLLAGGPYAFLFLLASIALIYGFSLALYGAREKGASKGTQKALLALGLVGNFGLLFVVKYLGWILGGIRGLLGNGIPELQILFPLGISFYTFASSGYLIEVYWGRVVPEKNPLKYAAFQTFFPQLMQGPIAKYSLLAPQMFRTHQMDPLLFRRGLFRICLGLWKKMVVSDWAAVFTGAFMADTATFSGAAGVSLLLYYIQLYMDFSGAMDVVVGIGDLFGLSLDENFKQPYLSTSLSLFWTRWHITLGRWMKEYVFFPLSLTRHARNLEKWGRKHFSNKSAKVLKMAYGELVVFLLVGIWHGANWLSVGFGLYNGLIIATSLLLTEAFKGMRGRLHLTGKEGFYVVFMILRTNLLFCLESVFDLATSIPEAFHVAVLAFTRWAPGSLLSVSMGSASSFNSSAVLCIIALGTLLVVVFGSLAERGWDIRSKVEDRPVLCMVLCGLFLLCIGFFGCSGPTRGFIYAQF